jgi:hypothetical protein
LKVIGHLLIVAPPTAAGVIFPWGIILTGREARLLKEAGLLSHRAVGLDSILFALRDLCSPVLGTLFASNPN